MMSPAVLVLTTLLASAASTPWSRNHGCPVSCTCSEEHFSDLALARYTRHEPYHVNSKDYEITNDVLNDDDDINFDDENPLLKVATCLLQAEINVEVYITTIPKDVQVLSLVKSFKSGNKTLRINYLNHFDELVAVELLGSESVNQNSTNNDLIVELDSSIISLKYLNLDQVRIRNAKGREIKLYTEENEEDIEIKFESVTMLQKKEDPEILPYYKYKEIQTNLETPILATFTNLILIRINACNLQNIHWEMFDGLQNLKYLILENNNLKFIPSFAFYGTPNLNKLSLAWNNLLNIQIEDLAGLLELEYLDLSHNNFSQLSELSFPPLPKLIVADFRDNPITIVFPNTFDIMNTTDSIILGAEEIRLQLMPNSFLGLKQLIKLTVHNVDIPALKQELLVGMPVLQELTMTGYIQKIEFDAFMEVRHIQRLILSNCNMYNISMDSFYGLQNLLVLDLSKNRLKYLPPNLFDDQIQMRELLLNGNELTEIPKGIFDKVPAKLIRLNDNPWHCSCALSELNPMVINKVKHKISSSCDPQHDKGLACISEKRYAYVYDNRMAPKCNTPNKLKNYSVFQAIRRHLRCKDHKLKLKNYKNKLSQKSTKIPPTPLPKQMIKLHHAKNVPPVQHVKYHKNVINNNNEISNLKSFTLNENRESNDIFNSNVDNFQRYGLLFSDVDNENDKLNKLKKKKLVQTQAKLKKLKKERGFTLENQHKEM